jgi:hypothetical protein
MSTLDEVHHALDQVRDLVGILARIRGATLTGNHAARRAAVAELQSRCRGETWAIEFEALFTHERERDDAEPHPDD